MRAGAVISRYALSLLMLAMTATAVADSSIKTAVDAAYERFLGVKEGENAQYIPSLASADPDTFAIVVATASGEVIGRGDTGLSFAIMSAAKPFSLSLLLAQRGPDEVMSRIGVEPTGQAFNALAGISRDEQRHLNPMVNAGAITTVSQIEAEDADRRWQLILDHYSSFAGEKLVLMKDVYNSVSGSNYHNRAIVNLLQEHRWLAADPDETLDIYNKQSSVGVTTRQLAMMGATLANGGVNPLSGEQVLDRSLVDEVLAVMMLSGFYDESGRWAFTAGLPAKSGVGGGIVAVVPGKMAIAAFSPRLSPSGNSVRAARAIAFISSELGLGLFDAGP